MASLAWDYCRLTTWVTVAQIRRCHNIALDPKLGGMFLCGANDLITIFVAPECFSLCSYLLSGYTKRDLRSNEATVKYLLMDGASPSILVHGFSWLYGSSGGRSSFKKF
ncbi:hypothetical protein ZWY2020_039732 [Hordeum vulgare]|nr:hypothetical protein ZWY2020_039732 [Hordeum vulgare]